MELGSRMMELGGSLKTRWKENNIQQMLFFFKLIFPCSIWDKCYNTSRRDYKPQHPHREVLWLIYATVARLHESYYRYSQPDSALSQVVHCVLNQTLSMLPFRYFLCPITYWHLLSSMASLENANVHSNHLTTGYDHIHWNAGMTGIHKHIWNDITSSLLHIHIIITSLSLHK